MFLYSNFLLPYLYLNNLCSNFYLDFERQSSAVVIYAKMCRGEMTRFIVKNRLECPEELKSFSWEGFVWDEIRSTENVWHFSLGTFM